MASARGTSAGKAGALLETVRLDLARAADPARAVAQQAYMKSAMPCHGVSSPTLHAICKRLFEPYPFDDAARWGDDVLSLWRGAEKREERYAAIELLLHRRARPFLRLDALPMIEEMIVDGAWWDFVDPIAATALGALLRAEPQKAKRVMLAWSRCDDVWKRRSAILCQLRFQADTDLDLLYACIEPSLARKEFWLRKAIGWALRQLAWTDPEEVVRYVEANRARLSGLSIREALKNVTSSPGRAGPRRSAAAAPRTPLRGRPSRSRTGG